MLNNKYLKTVLIGSLALSLSGCSDLLNTEPKQSVSPEVALSNLSGAQAIMVSAYNRMLASGIYSRNFTLTPDALADIFKVTPSNSQRLRADMINQQGTGTGNWGMYNVINDVNYIIDGVDALDATQAVKDRLKGESYFIRGLMYHNLVKSYAYEPGKEVGGFNHGVILRLTPTKGLTDADLRSRATNVEVYNQIEADLKQAITFLTGQNNNVYYANKAAAEAILARVYLYWGRWADAENYASQALANTTAQLSNPTNYVAGWESQPNRESLFELVIGIQETLGTNESLASVSTPYSSGWFDIQLTDAYLNKLEEGDARRNLLKFSNTGAKVGWYLDKFPGRKGNFADNIPVIRVAELLLIRAEARAEQNKLAEAVADINTLRTARSASAFASSNKDAIISFILDERVRELAYEGHRWFDLKRRGMDIPKSPETGYPALSYSSDHRLLSPIPQGQLDINPNLVANPGY